LKSWPTKGCTASADEGSVWKDGQARGRLVRALAVKFQAQKKASYLYEAFHVFEELAH